MKSAKGVKLIMRSIITAPSQNWSQFFLAKSGMGKLTGFQLVGRSQRHSYKKKVKKKAKAQSNFTGFLFLMW